MPEQVAAGKRQVVAVLACARTELLLAAFDPADGRQRWTAPLGGRTTPVPDGQMTLVSAEPAVVQTGGMTEGQPGAFLAFGAGGKSTGRIETTGAYGTVQAHTPALVAVAGGLRALDVTGGRVTVLADRGSRNEGLDELRVLDAVNGDEKESIEAGLDVDRAQGELAALFVYEKMVVAVRQDSGVRPFSVYARE